MAYPSPQLSPCQGTTSNMDEDHEIEQFFDNYVPLSNLPTPPLSAATTPTEEYIDITPSILAPAIHLTKLIPASASRNPLSPATLADYLSRAQPSQETLGFAACVLDSLSSTFIRSWRAAIIALPSVSNSSSNSHSNNNDNSTSSKRSSTHRPARSSALSASYHWKPELIALAALQVASGYVEDVRTSPRWWAEGVARGAVVKEELDASVRVMLKDIGYDLCGIQHEDVERMVGAMRRGVVYYEGLRGEESG